MRYDYVLEGFRGALYQLLVMVGVVIGYRF